MRKIGKGLVILAVAVFAGNAVMAEVVQVAYGTIWSDSAVPGSGSYSALEGDLTAGANHSIYGVKEIGGIERMYHNGTSWSVTTMAASGAFSGIAADRVDGQRLFAATSSGIDYLYDEGEGWVHNVNGVTATAGGYTDIETEEANNLYMYGAKPGGGMDIVSWNGSAWAKTSDVASDSTTVFNDLTSADGGSRYWVYGAVDGGGVKRYYHDGSWNQDTLTGITGEYAQLSADSTSEYRVFGIKEGGGADLIYWTGSAWDTIVFNTDVDYVSVSADSVQANYAYAAKADGGVDALYHNGSIWTVLEVDDGEYDVLTSSGTDDYRFYGNVIPEPATLGLIATFGGGMLFVRRKMMI